MNRPEVQAWLNRYVEAWRANDAALIGDLFTEDASYQDQPWADGGKALNGRGAIVARWRENPDDPGSWEASYEPYAVDGDQAVATGTRRYAATGDQPQRTYWNCYLLRFAPDGRCAELTEFYMLEGR